MGAILDKIAVANDIDIFVDVFEAIVSPTRVAAAEAERGADQTILDLAWCETINVLASSIG